MKRILVLASLASSIALAVACGGATDTELFGAPGSSEFGTLPSGDDPSSSGSTSGGGSSGLPGTGSSSSGGSTSSSGGTTSGGSSSGSSGTTVDAGTDAGSANKGIWCGEDNGGDDVYCAVGTACCASPYGPNGPSLTCAGGAITACPNNGLPIRCDDRTDCPTGQVCCGTFQENAGYQSIQCATSCNYAGGSIRSVRFCDPKAAVDECASIGKKCGWSQGLPGYGICK